MEQKKSFFSEILFSRFAPAFRVHSLSCIEKWCGVRMSNFGLYRYFSTECVDNVYSRCARPVRIQIHGTNMQKSVSKALLWQM